MTGPNAIDVDNGPKIALNDLMAAVGHAAATLQIQEQTAADNPPQFQNDLHPPPERLAAELEFLRRRVDRLETIISGRRSNVGGRTTQQG